MDELRIQLEIIRKQLELRNQDFLLNLQSTLSSIPLPGQSQKLQNHIEFLSKICTEEPDRAINIIRKYISILDSPAIITTQKIPVDISKTISITNCHDQTTHTSRILPGTEISFSYDLTILKIGLEENSEPLTNQISNLSIYIKEDPSYPSKIKIDANDQKIDQGQFYLIMNSLLYIENVSDDEIRAKFYSNIMMDSIDQINLSELRYIEYLIDSSNFKFDLKTDRLEKSNYFVGEYILFLKNETNWIFVTKLMECFLFLGNPLSASLFSKNYKLNPKCPQLFINSTPYIISISN